MKWQEKLTISATETCTVVPNNLNCTSRSCLQHLTARCGLTHSPQPTLRSLSCLSHADKPDHQVSSGASETPCQLWLIITGHAYWTTDKFFTALWVYQTSPIFHVVEHIQIPDCMSCIAFHSHELEHSCMLI